MKIRYLHLSHTIDKGKGVRVTHNVTEVIHDVNSDDSARGLATMIQVISQIMERALAESIGFLPEDRVWTVHTLEYRDKGKKYQPKDTPAAQFGLADK